MTDDSHLDTPEIGDRVECLEAEDPWGYRRDLDGEVVKVFKNGKLSVRGDDGYLYKVPAGHFTVLAKAG